MTTKEKIEVMQGYLDGKIIQKLYDDGWVDCSIEEEPDWDWDCDYRIKPEPKLRPYRNPEEFLQAQKEHGPYLRSGVAQYYLPIMVDMENGIVYADRYDVYFRTYEELMGQRVWQDGTPCGITEEE